MIEVGFVAALAAGALALLSPCSALLVPSFFAYAFGTTQALLGRTFVFYLGLCATLVPLGTGAGAASTLFYGHRATLIGIAGWMIIAFGIIQILGRGFTIPFAQRLNAAVAQRGGTGWASTAALGAVYGLAGFCSGPVLGAILTVAATQGSPWQGGGLLAVYALGMALPLFVLALLWDRFDLGRKRWLRGRSWQWGIFTMHTSTLVSGLLFVAIGVLFLRYDGTAGLTGALGFGDLTDLEFTLQMQVSEWAAKIPAWLLPTVVAAGAGWIAWRRIGSSADSAPPAGSAPPVSPNPAATQVDGPESESVSGQRRR
ncbi:MAG: cytochrome c biogenesis CcdA family protein [Nocardioides sp.]